MIAGDGCLMEGISHEAIALAGRQRLGKLIVLWDNNNITIDGEVDFADRTNQVQRFRASGWHVTEIDGHDPDEIDAALTMAKTPRARPSMIACKTHIGARPRGAGHPKGHGALTDPTSSAPPRTPTAGTGGPFEVPAEVKSAWEEIGRRGAAERAAWKERLAASERRQAEFARIMAGEAPKKLSARIKALKKQVSAEAAQGGHPQIQRDGAGGRQPDHAGDHRRLGRPERARTTPRPATWTVFDEGNRKGRYIHYGIREHGMAAAMNGMALHGGVRPYGGTFMCFTDYARPAMRLAALMKVPTVFVMTHDSIGLGEDGPTHQPVEHLAISRATPNTHGLPPLRHGRDGRGVGTGADSRNRTPSVLSLTRQGVPTLRTEHKTKNLTAQGAYVLAEADGKRQAILLATGSEVHVAMAAREALQAEGIGTRVVSMPCWELFAAQDEGYRKRVLPAGPVRVGVEAAVRQGWDRWLCGERGRAARAGFVGMEGFGASAPGDDALREVRHHGASGGRQGEIVALTAMPLIRHPGEPPFPDVTPGPPA